MAGVTIEDVIAREVRATGMSRAAVATALGMSEAALAARLRGRTRWAAAEVPEVCDLVGLDITELYAEVRA